MRRRRRIRGVARSASLFIIASLLWFGLVWFGLVWFGLVVMADDDEIDLGEVRASYW
jgi:hypothetical protein